MAVDTQKFLALPPAKKGGDLASAIKPKESSKKTVGGKLIVIKTKIVKASDILKGTLAAEKKQINDQRKIDEKNKRSKKEEEIEQPKEEDKDAKKLKIKLPAFSWLDAIKNFIFTVLFGWAAVRLLKFLPELVKLLKPLAAIASFIMKVGELILKSLVTLVDWGYKAYEWTRGAVGTVFGQDGVKKFDQISGVLNKVLNLTMTLALGMIALSNEFGSSMIDFGKGFISIFKRGLLRAGPRILIKLFGKKTATTILTKLGVKTALTSTATTAATTATATTATATTATAGGTAATVGGVSAGVAAAAVAAAGALAVGLGEGIFALGKKGYAVEEDWRKKADEKWWTDPRKYWWGIGAGVLGIINRAWSFLGGIFDIIGAPFRMLGELIMFPFLSEEGKKKQRDNLVKYDTRIREQFRKFANMFDPFGLVSDDEGSWGSIYGKTASEKASKEMGFEKKSDKKKDDKKKVNKKTTTIIIDKFNQPKTQTLLESGKRGNIEQALYNMRISAAEGSGEAFNDWVGNEKYAGDVDLIMKHGLQNVIITGGRVTLKGNAKNIVPVDVESVKKKTNEISKSTSYESGSDSEVIVEESGDESSVGTGDNEDKQPVGATTGGGGDSSLSESAALQYKNAG